MKNKLIGIIIYVIISITIVTIPSAIIAFGINMFQEINHFWSHFIISFGVIIVIGFLSNIYSSYKLAKMELQVQLANHAETLAQSVEVQCAYCKTRIITPIKLSERVVISCPHCKKTNLIIFQFGAVQISTPLELPQLTRIVQDTKEDNQ